MKNDAYYLVMPFYPLTLSKLLDSPNFNPIKTQAFSRLSSALMKQMALAVRYIHSAGIAHRDINPSNFVIGSQGQIVLIDFGIAYCGPDTNEKADSLICEVGTGYVCS